MDLMMVCVIGVGIHQKCPYRVGVGGCGVGVGGWAWGVGNVPIE